MKFQPIKLGQKRKKKSVVKSVKKKFSPPKIQNFGKKINKPNSWKINFEKWCSQCHMWRNERQQELLSLLAVVTLSLGYSPMTHGIYMPFTTKTLI